MSDVQELVKNTDFEVSSLDAATQPASQNAHSKLYPLRYMAVGIVLGIIFVKAEIISWFRILEMFRLQNFHMYGVIGAAVAVSALAVWLIKRFNVKTIDGEPVTFVKKQYHKGQVIGGLIFGLGWALTGACPGPMFAMLGTGAFAAAAMVLSAIAGTWVYGLLRDKLPH